MSSHPALLLWSFEFEEAVNNFYDGDALLEVPLDFKRGSSLFHLTKLYYPIISSRPFQPAAFHSYEFRYRVGKEAAAGDETAGEDDGEDEGGGAAEDLGAEEADEQVEHVEAGRVREALPGTIWDRERTRFKGHSASECSCKVSGGCEESQMSQKDLLTEEIFL